MNLNKVYVAGNLTAQPELQRLPSGNSVCQFSIATNRVWKDQSGQKQQDVEWVNCVLFGKRAEAFVQYAVKGQSFLIEGRMKTRDWQDKETGKKMYRTEVIVENFHFGQKPNTNSGYQNKSRQENDDWNSYTDDLGDGIPETGGLNGSDIPF